MKKIIIIFISLSLLFLTSCWNKEDKKISTEFLQNNYSEEFHELNLAAQELTNVPNFEKYLTWSYIDNVWSINLMNNNIKEVDWKIFKYFPNLKELNLSYNKIEKITLEHNFIQNIKLHKNSLKKVDLNWLKKLNTINLWYNNILSLNDLWLPKNIQSLELQHNKLVDIEWILEFKNLEILKLEFNELEDEDLNKLDELKQLKHISTWFNKTTKKIEKKSQD